MGKINIILDGEFTTANEYIDAERENKFSGSKLKNFETTRVYYSTVNRGFVAGRYPVRITFHWYRVNKRSDPDNVEFAKKFILDGLQKSRVIKNDGWNQIASTHNEFYIDKNNPRVEVVIEW